MKIKFRRSGALVLGAVLALIMVVPIALAYEGQIEVILVETNPPGLQLRCPGGTNLTATLVPGGEGADVKNVELHWTLTGGGRLARTTTKTNANGVSHNTVILPPGSTSGPRTVTVTAVDPGFGTNTFFATCPARGQPGGGELGAGGQQTPPFTGLPGTDALPAGKTDFLPFALIVGLAVLFATIGIVPRVRRRLTP
jgi:hypothetical protein